MLRLKIAGLAESDLTDIGDYIAIDSPLNASRFVGRLRENFTLLAGHPHIGRAREEFASGLRSIAFGRYVIFYRVSDDTVEIVRIIHGARDVGRILLGS